MQRSYIRTEEHKEKMRRIIKEKYKNNNKMGFQKGHKQLKGKDSHLWKGNDIGYLMKHLRIIDLKGKALEYICIDCGKQAEDWSNKDHLYSNNLDDYIPRCRKCHCEYDKEFNNTKRGKRKIK